MPKPNDVGVGIAIAVLDVSNEDEPRILLMKRAGAHQAGTLACPGGWVESQDKDPRQTCKRELEEEIGLSIETSELQLLTVTSEYHESISVRSVTIYYAVEYDEIRHGVPAIKETDKATNLNWYDIYVEERPEPLFPKLDDAWDVIEELLSRDD